MTPNELQVGSAISLPWFENNKFVIHNIISGGMGTVYQLFPIDPRVRTYGLKTFQSEVDPKQFSKECETWLSVSGHPSIARALQYGNFQGRPCILSRWYPFTLREQKLAEWTTVQLYKLVIGLLDALKYLDKDFKLIHQDIKPANILLENDLTPKLTDFGIVRAIRSAGVQFGNASFDSNRTVNAEGISGTPFYMAPEILLHKVKPSVSTDIFSLGVTLYQKLTEQHPYLSSNGRPPRKVPDIALLKAQLRKHGDKGERLREVIVSMLELDPRVRPNNYDQLFAGLQLKSNEYKRSNIEVQNRAIETAKMYRNEGKYKLAYDVLFSALDEMPKNPALLNSLAMLAVTTKDLPKAIQYLQSAAAILISSNGLHNGQIYPDPLVNLSWQLIVRQEFKLAYDYLSIAWNWLSSEKHPTIQFLYPEFGWMLLYERKFNEAGRYLLEHAKHHELQDIALVWLALSVWLARTAEEHAASVFQLMARKQSLSIELAIVACLFSGLKTQSTKFLSLLSQDMQSQIAAIELQAGLGKRGLRPPSTKDAISLLVRSLDQCTGGRADGYF